MSVPSSRAVVAHSGTQSKGTIFRGVVRELRRTGDFPAVRARVPPRVAALLDDPPPATAWVPIEDAEPVLLVLAELRGLGAVRALARSAATNDIAPVLSSFVSGALRVFGATPHALFKRVNDMVGITTRGLRVEYSSLGERSARLRHVFSLRREVPMAQWVAISGGLEFVFGLTNVNGWIDAPKVVPDGAGNAADLDAHW